MNNKSNKKKKLKRKASQDDLAVAVQNKGFPCQSKKKKRKLAAAKKKSKMSSQATSSSYSTTSSKDTFKEDDSEEYSKLQCDLCKLSYSTKDKLTEHLVSLMHHTKLEDAEKNSSHKCILCNSTFTDMPSYRDHIGTKAHLQKLEFHRGPNKQKQEKNKNWKHNNNYRGENGPVNQEPRYQNTGPPNPMFNKNAGWQEMNYPRGQNYGNFQNPHFHHNFGRNMPENSGFNSNRQQSNPKYYGSKQNNWHNNKNYSSRWDMQYNPRKDRMDFDNSYEGEKNLPWGSGAANYRNAMAQSNNNVNFSEDRFDFCWDEQSFRQHEDFLADMDQGYQRDRVEFHHRGSNPRHLIYPQQGGGRHNGPDTGYYRKDRWDGSSYNDRKRPRNEDYPLDPNAKSSKPREQEKDDDDSAPNESPGFEGEILNAPKSRTVPQNVTKTVTSQKYEKTTHQDKSGLDNASDSILERAERLCKELREKREASSSQRVNLLKTQTHHSINDKMNNLKKNKQSYLKGHIKNPSTDQVTKGDNTSTMSTIPSTSALPQKSKEVSTQNKLSSSSKSKTLDEIRKSIEQSVLDDTRSVPTVGPQLDKPRSRVRATSLSDASSGQSKGKTDPLADSDGKHSRPSHKVDSNIGGSKTGPKQSITKENLNKMVNCPRSRTERLQLARMFQSRADSKSSAPVTHSRPSINLEGLYDSPDVADIEIDVGGSMSTIKLEDLSDDVRSQILGLIQDDIGVMQSNNCKQRENDVEIISIDEDETTQDVTAQKEFIVGDKDSAGKKLKKKSINSKTHKKSKETHISESQPMSANRDSIQKTNFLSKANKDGYSRFSRDNDQENSETHKLAKGSALVGTKFSKNNIPDKVNSVEQNSSPRLTKENVLSRYPTILSTLGTNISPSTSTVDKEKSPSIDDGKDKGSVDSGRSSLSLSASSMPVPASSSSIPPFSRSSFLSSLSPDPMVHPTVTMSSEQTPTTSIEDTFSLLNSCPPFMSEQPQNASDARSKIVSSLGTDVPSSTMSELLALSEQEESVKQEMMSMELRLKRLHRLLEQAVHQINKCTERRNELQDEEKSLTGRRFSLLREATSSQQESQSSISTASLATTTPSSQPIAEYSANAPERQHLSSATDLPQPTTQHNSHIPQSSLSRSEWLAKFSAYLPSEFISSSNDSSSKRLSPCSQTSAIDQSSHKQSVYSVSSISTSTIPTSTKTHLSPDPSLIQMVPERDLEPTAHPESYVRFNSSNRQNSNEPSVSGSKDGKLGESKPASNPDKSSDVTQEFTSPIMYVGTIKSADGQSSKNDKAAPVMMLSSATLSSLFSGGSDLRENLNPVKIVGRGDQVDFNRENSIPPVVRRPSIGSPRQEDSDIGSIASVASGSSLGEQISRYCRFTPGASADGHNPHDLSVILSGPSDTSDLRGLEEDDDNFGERRVRSDKDDDNSAYQNDKVNKLKEDVGNNRLYGHLNQESIKSAEALHLMERNNEVPSSTIDKKKKKRKTKQQRDIGIKGRPKPYVISSSSCDEHEARKTIEDSCRVSNLEQRLRKSPESTDEDSSDHPHTSGRQVQSQPDRSNLSPSKVDQGTEITIAECDSSTNLGMIDSQSLNESSSRLKEMNESFEKTFGRKPRDRTAFINEFQSKKGSVVVLSDDDDERERSHQKESKSDVIDLCGEDDIQQSSMATVRNTSGSEKASLYPGTLGSVCFIRCLDEKMYVAYLNNGFKVFDMSTEDTAKVKYFSIPKLSCMEMAGVRDDVKVYLGTGHSIIATNMKTEDWTVMDKGTTVKCLHIQKNHLYAGLDTGEICVHDIKSRKDTDCYICSDSPIQCITSGTEGGTRVLCVASQDSTITVVDADRCLPLRMLTTHTKTALSVQVYSQYVFSCSGDSTVVIHNLHSARVEKVFKDNKGIVNSVFYSQGHLFAGGLDRLVRVYNIKSNKLVQVYYGAGMGSIKTIYVQDKQLITGNTRGSVDIVDLDLNAKNVCKYKTCGLNFGLASHLAWHLAQVH